jgi:hypothetical protein
LIKSSAQIQGIFDFARVQLLVASAARGKLCPSPSSGWLVGNNFRALPIEPGLSMRDLQAAATSGNLAK